MAKVEIFWREGCGFCTQVQSLFTKKGVEYIGYNIWADKEAEAEMKTRIANARTVPQVFIDGNHIGGCDHTLALDRSGELDKLLGL